MNDPKNLKNLADSLTASPKGTFRRWVLLLGPALLVIGVDRLTKALVLRDLADGGIVVPIPALGEYLSFMFSRNTGAAFSLLPQAGDLFLLIAVLMVAGILIFYRRMLSSSTLERLALGLLLGGASGNAIDRILYGFVVDWVHLRLPGVISNVSNLADHSIVIGIGVLFILAWRAYPAREPSSTHPRSE